MKFKFNFKIFPQRKSKVLKVDKSENVIEKPKEKTLQTKLLSLVNRSYILDNFTTSFISDYDRKGMEFKPKLFHFTPGEKVEFRENILKYLKNGPLVIIDPNQSISRDWAHGNYKKGGVNFRIFTMDKDGKIIEYDYKNIKCHYTGIRETINMGVWEYENSTQLINNNPSIIYVDINRMLKVERVIQKMVDDQKIDKDHLNSKKLDKILSL